MEWFRSALYTSKTLIRLILIVTNTNNHAKNTIFGV